MNNTAMNDVCDDNQEHTCNNNSLEMDHLTNNSNDNLNNLNMINNNKKINAYIENHYHDCIDVEMENGSNGRIRTKI